MFIGHIPGAYLLSKKLLCRPQQTRNLIMLTCLAGVLPDVDLFYFYLIDHRQHPHHEYWTHIPVFWLLVCGAVYAGLVIGKKQKYLLVLKLMGAGVFLHLLLDSVVGKIAWLYPLKQGQYHLFEVSSIYSWWVANYLLHWTFLFELLLCLLALLTWMKPKVAETQS